MTTETIDKLFLELSQITKAETNKEFALKASLEQSLHWLRSVYSQIGNHRPAEKRHAVTPAVQDGIRDFLKKYGFNPEAE